MKGYTDKVKDEIARQARGMGCQQYAEFLATLAREINIMASYAAGNNGKPALSVVPNSSRSPRGDDHVG